MKNKIEDLNNHLFDMIERIMDKDLTKEEITLESFRAATLCNIAIQVVNVGKLAAVGYELADGSFGKKRLPAFFLEEGYNDNATEPTAEAKPEDQALLHFRRNNVSPEQHKREKLYRSN
jgi:hypothetical protein